VNNCGTYPITITLFKGFVAAWQQCLQANVNVLVVDLYCQHQFVTSAMKAGQASSYGRITHGLGLYYGVLHLCMWLTAVLCTAALCAAASSRGGVERLAFSALWEMTPEADVSPDTHLVPVWI
jgi:hypothetical protein